MIWRLLSKHHEVTAQEQITVWPVFLSISILLRQCNLTDENGNLMSYVLCLWIVFCRLRQIQTARNPSYYFLWTSQRVIDLRQNHSLSIIAPFDCRRIEWRCRETEIALLTSLLWKLGEADLWYHTFSTFLMFWPIAPLMYDWINSKHGLNLLLRVFLAKVSNISSVMNMRKRERRSTFAFTARPLFVPLV